MTSVDHKNPPIKLLVVDDSWVLRRVLRGTLSQRDDVETVGEATNGIEALEMILSLKPDVILLDMEMPVMDGLTTLQHLMIHTPTPTIALSSLSQKGTAICFDALKYGAVDFVGKNSFSHGMDSLTHSKLVLAKVLNASKITVKSIDPKSQGAEYGTLKNEQEQFIFCEDCGTRHIIQKRPQKDESIKCSNCGDELSFLISKRHIRMNFLTIIGCGEGGYANLLKIVPDFNPEMGGALCVVILDTMKNVESFVKYLDAISNFEVILGQDGTMLEGGCCYLISNEKQVQLSPYSGNYTLQMETEEDSEKSGIIDRFVESAASLLKNRVAVVLLSGVDSDGRKGMEKVLDVRGTGLVLSPEYCLQKDMITELLEHYTLESGLDEADLAEKIQKCHFDNKGHVTTA